MSTYLKSISALYARDYVRRTKTCEYCGVEFCDVTKRNLRHTCDDACDTNLMVRKRRERQSYVRTEEQKRKTSESLKIAYSSGVRLITEDHRKVMSQTMRETWARGSIDTANHWARTDDGRKKISQRTKGVKLGPNPKLSLSAQKRLRTKRELLYTSAHGGTRVDLNHYFRSGWEANFARILNYEKKSWTYEFKTFQLDISFSYTPDFYVHDENVYYEIKGRMDEKSIRQLSMMGSLYPEVTLVLVDKCKYEELRTQYKKLLPEWEGR